MGWSSDYGLPETLSEVRKKKSPETFCHLKIGVPLSTLNLYKDNIVHIAWAVTFALGSI